MVGQNKVQERTRRHHRQRCELLGKPSKFCQNLGSGLNFVQEKQRRFGRHALPRMGFDGPENVARVIAGKEFRIIGVSLEAELDQPAVQHGSPNRALTRFCGPVWHLE